MWGYLVLTVTSIAWQCYSWWFMDVAMNGDGSVEFDFETYGALSNLNWGVSLVCWVAVIFGLWKTGASTESPLLQRAAKLFAFEFFVDLLLGLLMKFESVAPDAQWLSYAFVATTLIQVAGAVCVLAHAKRRGASPQSMFPPAFAQFAFLAMIAWFSLAGPNSKLDPNIYAALRLGVSVFYWLSWLTLPKAAFSIEPAEGTAWDTAAPEPRVSATQDLVVGLIWVVGGSALTFMSFDSGGIEGRAVFAYGPIIYGLFRIFRGLAGER